MQQALKASGALLAHINSERKRKQQTSKIKDLLATDDDSSEDIESGSNDPIWLILTTKRHIIDKTRLKPGKISLPHSLNNTRDRTICLITADPQRQFKDVVAHPAFPTSLSSHITRVVGVTKLKGKFKSFESRRQLLSEHDVFLADDRVVTILPRILGRAFFGGRKRPIPVNLQPLKPRDTAGKRIPFSKDSSIKPTASPAQFAKEIERALSCTQIQLAPSVTTSIHVGLANFTAQQVTENIEAVVKGMVDKFVPKGWRNIRAIHVKGANTMALPIWQTDELWVEAKDVLEPDQAKAAIEAANQKVHKRKIKDIEEGDVGKDSALQKNKRIKDKGMNKEMAERKEKLKQQKQEAREALDMVEPQTTTGKTASEKEEVKVKSKKAKSKSKPMP